MTKRVRIHPSFDPNWSSYFLRGLIDRFGFGALEFSREGFPEVDDVSARPEGGLLYFRLLEEDRRVVVQTDDGLDPHASALDWCNVYAQVNQRLAASDPPEIEGRRRVSCAPHFVIRLPFRQRTAIARATFALGLASPVGHLKKHVYRPLRYHAPLEAYERPGVGEPGYVFMVSSIWKSNPETNRERARFMDACRAHPRVRFEGGFWPRRRGDVDLSGISHLVRTHPRRYLPSRYLEAMRRSAFVFVNPSVAGNTSWRLGESLAMGKAIIATRFQNRLVAPLRHGHEIHLTEPTTEGIAAAVDRLASDEDYRRHLESGARRYYAEQARPLRLVASILEE